jgi:hypothetical protein
MVLMLDPVSPSYFTPGRTWASIAGLVGLAGLVLGAWALARIRSARARQAATGAVVAGVGSAVGGALVVAAAEGGPGTGYGIVGGYVALVVGLAAVVLGGWALARRARVRS